MVAPECASLLLSAGSNCIISIFSPLAERFDLNERRICVGCMTTPRRSHKARTDVSLCGRVSPLRCALARHVHHQTQTKRGFAISIDAWLRGPLRATFEQTLLGRQEIFGLPLNRQALQDLFHLHLSGQANHGNGLWMLLSLVLWKERGYDRSQADSMMAANF